MKEHEPERLHLREKFKAAETASRIIYTIVRLLDVLS